LNGRVGRGLRSDDHTIVVQENGTYGGRKRSRLAVCRTGRRLCCLCGHPESDEGKANFCAVHHCSRHRSVFQ
jgi:hypothetical protein